MPSNEARGQALALCGLHSGSQVDKQLNLHRFMETHVPVPRQSATTGKLLGSVEWIPKIMLDTRWAIPRHVFDRMVAGFAFSKARGHDVMVFR
ncbi:MAG: hypothetical protein Q6373_023980, partial [Candidatus Sigynarchaeota archaeon]